MTRVTRKLPSSSTISHDTRRLQIRIWPNQSITKEIIWCFPDKIVALLGMGKRGSARTLIATRSGRHWFFVFGFKKNERANISAAELEALQQLATDLLAQNTEQLTEMLNDGALEEIIDGKAKA